MQEPFRHHEFRTYPFEDVPLNRDVFLIDERWLPYDAATEKVILEDYQRIWRNNALANLSIEIRDFLFSNGVIGKVVVYNITERN